MEKGIEGGKKWEERNEIMYNQREKADEEKKIRSVGNEART